MREILETMSVPVQDGADVIVVGGGIAGVSAAVAARRCDCKVLLIEKQATLGGLATGGLISWYEPLCDGHGEQLIYGLPEELLRLSIRYGDDTLPEIWKDRNVPVDKAQVKARKTDPIGGRYATLYSPTMCQLALDELLITEGVEIRLDILGVRPIVDGNSCVGISCESKSGRQFFPAKVVIDATGDAEMLWRAGLPCVNGENYFSVVAHLFDISGKECILKQRRWISAGSDLHGNGHPKERKLVSGTTNEEISEFLLSGRMALLNKLRNDDRKSRDLASLPTMPQFRKIRRLSGEYTLSGGDLFVHQENSIGLICDFERPGDWYEIPWGCLYNKQMENMLAAGRMISSDGRGWEVTRVIPVCAVTGQAAGVAAAEMILHNTAAAEIPICRLQDKLRSQGVRLHHAKQ